jgi:hypothetical protein
MAEPKQNGWGLMDCSRARTKNPGEWLETCPDFSQPLAEQVVKWFLTWEPDLAESIKWNMLCFSGRKLVCGLSACRAHLGITFFRGTKLPDPARLFNPGGEVTQTFAPSGSRCSIVLRATRCVTSSAPPWHWTPTRPSRPRPS